MMTQKEIDELLQDSSTSNINVSTSKQKNFQPSNSEAQIHHKDNYN